MLKICYHLPDIMMPQHHECMPVDKTLTVGKNTCSNNIDGFMHNRPTPHYDHCVKHSILERA